MISILTFNPSIDRLYKVSHIKIGEVQRVDTTNATAGGKGINVSKVCKLLNEDPLAIGFLGGFNGEFIKNELNRLQIKEKFTCINQESRTCLNIIEDNIQSTEFLEKGPILQKEDFTNFEETLKEVLKESKILVASGSYCQNTPVDYYKRIGDLCQELGVKFILDTSSEALKEALASKPYLIKPNIDELRQLFSQDIKSKKEIIKAGEKLIDLGVKNVCISLGKEGMIYLTADKEVFEVTIPKIKVINPVGSGDSSLAGLAVGILRGYSIREMLTLANACGMSNALHLETGFINMDEINELKKRITINNLNN